VRAVSVQVGKQLAGLSSSLQRELETTAKDIASSVMATKEGLEGQIGGMMTQLGMKVDTQFMSELERSLRDEIARLAAKGTFGVAPRSQPDPWLLRHKVDSTHRQECITSLAVSVLPAPDSGGQAIDAAALEARLQALRDALAAEMAQQEEAANGSAAFKCLLCDRALPPKEDWQLKARRNPADGSAPSMPHSHAEVSERACLRDVTRDVTKGSGGNALAPHCFVGREARLTLLASTPKGGTG
jgi:hypothetical protein